MAGKLSLLTLLTGGRASTKDHKTKGRMQPAAEPTTAASRPKGAPKDLTPAAANVRNRSAGSPPSPLPLHPGAHGVGPEMMSKASDLSSSAVSDDVTVIGQAGHNDFAREVGQVPPALADLTAVAAKVAIESSAFDQPSPQEAPVISADKDRHQALEERISEPTPQMRGGMWRSRGEAGEERETSYDGEDDEAEYEEEEEEEEEGSDHRGANDRQDSDAVVDRGNELRPVGDDKFLMGSHASMYYESPGRRASEGSQYSDGGGGGGSDGGSGGGSDGVGDKGHVSDPGAFTREAASSFRGSPLHPAALHRMLDDQSERQSERQSELSSSHLQRGAGERRSGSGQHQSSSEVECLEQFSRGEDSESNRTNGSLSGTRSLVPYVGFTAAATTPAAAAGPPAGDGGFEFQCAERAGAKVSLKGQAYLPAHLWDRWGLSPRDAASAVAAPQFGGAGDVPGQFLRVADVALEGLRMPTSGRRPWWPPGLHRSASLDALADSQARPKANVGGQLLLESAPKARSVAAFDELHEAESDGSGGSGELPAALLLENPPQDLPHSTGWHGPSSPDDDDTRVEAGGGGELEGASLMVGGREAAPVGAEGVSSRNDALNWVDQWVNSINLDDLPAGEEWELPVHDDEVSRAAAGKEQPLSGHPLLRKPKRSTSSGHLALQDGGGGGGGKEGPLVGPPMDADLEQAAALVRGLDRTASAAHFAARGLRVTPPLATFHLLKSLDLSRNNIARIHAGTLPKSLHVLDLSHNRLVAIEGFRDLARLRALNLSSNRITRIGHGLAGCSALRELYLAGNKISEVEGLHRLLKLAVLDLSHNKLTSNKALGQLAANYASMQALNLTGNPIHANLGDSAFRRYITSLLPHLIYLNRLPLNPTSAREIAKDNVTRAALGAPGHHSSRALAASAHHSSARSSKPSSGGGGGGGRDPHRSRHGGATSKRSSSAASGARKPADPKKPSSSRSQRAHRSGHSSSRPSHLPVRHPGEADHVHHHRHEQGSAAAAAYSGHGNNPHHHVETV